MRMIVGRPAPQKVPIIMAMAKEAQKHGLDRHQPTDSGRNRRTDVLILDIGGIAFVPASPAIEFRRIPAALGRCCYRRHTAAVAGVAGHALLAVPESRS